MGYKYKYFKSTEVKIFPCYRRGVYDVSGSMGNETTDIVTKSKSARYDHTARLITEYNLTHLYGMGGKYDSYIVSTTMDTTTQKILKICAIIKGYYFEITNKTGFEQSVIGGSLICCIKSDKPDSQGEVTLHAIKIDKSSGTDILIPEQNTSLDYKESDDAEGICLAVVYSDKEVDPEDLEKDFYSVPFTRKLQDLVADKADLTMKLDTETFNTWAARHAGADAGHAKTASEITAEIKRAVAGEKTLREAADKDITNTLGTGFDKGDNTVAKKIAAAEANAKSHADRLADNSDAAGAAATAEQNAKSHANSVATTARSEAISEANGYTDSKVATLTAKDSEIEDKVTTLQQLTFGYTGEGAIKTAVEASAETAQSAAEAKAAELDTALHTKISKEIDEDVAAAIAAEITRSDAKTKELADAAEENAKSYAESLLQTVTVTLEFTTTIEEETVRKEISALKQLPFYMPSYNAVFDENAQYAGKWYLEDLSYEYEVGSMANLFDLQVAEGKDKITFIWTEDTSD